MTRTSRLLASLLLAGGAIAAMSPSAEAAGGWTVSPTQTISGQNLYLKSVAVPAAGDVWAVGYRYISVGGATEFRTLVEHSTGGGAFQLVASPDREGAPATNFLEDVAAVSPTDVWAVGWSRNPGDIDRTLVEHWDGTSWSIMPSQDPGVHGDIFEGVLARGANDVWAVGARQDDFYQVPMAEHWDGTSWTVTPMPNPGFCTGHSYLTDIAAVQLNNLWAVGWCTASGRGGEQGYVLRWDGTKWRIHPATAMMPHNSEIYGVSALGPYTVWLTGMTRDGGGLTLHWDGTSLTRLPAWTGQSNTVFAGVVAVSSKAAWAVGAGGSPQPPFAGPAAVKFSSASTGTSTPQPPPIDYGRLYGVARDPAGRLWGVGTQFPGQYNTPLVVSRPL